MHSKRQRVKGKRTQGTYKNTERKKKTDTYKGKRDNDFQTKRKLNTEYLSFIVLSTSMDKTFW